MFTYAKTNIQLFNQLRCLNYSSEEIIFIRKAYDSAILLFSGLYRPSGSTFISHLVGTAGILASLHLSREMVVSGLLHAAYEHGDFGISGMNNISKRKRKYLRELIGEEAEEYIARYTLLKWNSQTIPVIRNRFDSLDLSERSVLLIRIANELEDNLDLAPLFCPDAERRRDYIKRFGSDIIYMADKLGVQELASELKQIFTKIISGTIPPGLRSISSNNRAYRVSPKSYKRNLTAEINKLVLKGMKRFKKLFNLK